MRIIAIIAMTVLTMTFLLSSGAESAVSVTPEKSTVSDAAQERKTQRSLTKRNAAAKKLKAQIDKDKQNKGTQQSNPVN